MLEEAEKNAAADKLKKGLVSIIYEYDNLLARAEIIEPTPEFVNITKDGSRTFFRKIIENLKSNYKKNKLKTISTMVEEKYINLAFEAILFDVLQSKLKKRKKSLVIDVSDDGN